jgi:hypothetical protein
VRYPHPASRAAGTIRHRYQFSLDASPVTLGDVFYGYAPLAALLVPVALVLLRAAGSRAAAMH